VHIQAGRALDLPLVIHTRSAVRRHAGHFARARAGRAGARRGGVFHCFTETKAVARAALDLGFYISFSGIVTFKSAQDLRDMSRHSCRWTDC
jgi:TatD DNase family protein